MKTTIRSGPMVLMLASMAIGMGMSIGTEDSPPDDDEPEGPPPLTWPPPSKGDALLAELRAKSPSRRQREGRDRGRW